MVVLASNPSTWEAKASLGYIETLSHKKTGREGGKEEKAKEKITYE
jgi:hypothetical protein